MDKPTPFTDDAKPWGGYTRYTLNQPSTVKLLWLDSGKRFSLQTHKDRDEWWIILKGNPTITLNDETFTAHTRDEIWSPRGTIHRMEATDGDVEFLEISFGRFDEDDITRLSDDFGRS